VAEWRRDTPWRQGQLLGVDAIEALELLDPAPSENKVVVVATHDCDLAQSPAGEPYIEVIVGKIIDPADQDGNCTHAKNARKLHIEFEGNPPVWVELDATSKKPIEKMRLAPFSPASASQLSPEDLAIFQIWLASRYRRSAFPDEFERRLTREAKLAEKIAKSVKPHGNLITGVFFDVDEGEEIARNGPEDPYKLDITILHAAGSDFLSAEAAAMQAATTIRRAFEDKLFDPTKGWRYIELRSCEAVAESVLTYWVFKQLKRWRLDYISLAASPQHPVLSE
jgi:hypothetical protein